MRYKNSTLLFLLMTLSAAGFAQTVRYDVQLDTALREMTVKGMYYGSTGSLDTSKWNFSRFGISTYDKELPRPVNILFGDKKVSFSYSVPIPVKNDLNSPDFTLDSDVLSAWGWHLFAIPYSSEKISSISVRFHFPGGWKWISSLGYDSVLAVPTFQDLLGMALTAGTINPYEVQLKHHKLRLGIDKRSLIDPAHYIDTLSRIINGVSKYLGAEQLPGNVFFAVRMLHGRPTFAPGNHESTSVQSNTILFNGNNDNGANPGFWATYAHEVLHALNPGRLKNYAAYEKEFGDWFTEGFTNILAYKILLKERLITKEQFLKKLMHYAREYEYVLDKKMGDQYLAYSKGMLLGFMMDVKINQYTKGEKDFFTLFKKVVDKSADLPHSWGGILQETGGAELVAVYQDWMKSEKLPWMQLLNEAGITITQQPNYKFSATVNPPDAVQKRELQNLLGN
jgi:predicted metalloprotease with PDZ domain